MRNQEDTASADPAAAGADTPAQPGGMRDRLRAAERASYWQRRELVTLADALQGELEGTLVTANQVSDSMEEAATGIAEALSRVEAEAASLSETASGAGTAIERVSGAAGELSDSARTIGEKVGQTSSRAQGAVSETEQANDVIGKLAHASERIGAIVKLIQDIASQTNLLALNATIEAARAGEAGKGFAVVANEVKSLAQQTGDATKDIAAQIEEIQNVAESVVDAIDRIGSAINDVERESQEASAAVSQQQEVIGEISRSADETAESAKNVAAAVETVVDGVGEAARLAETQYEHAKSVHATVKSLEGRLSTTIASSRDREADYVPERLPVDLHGDLTAGGESVPCLLRDLSDRDAWVESRTDAPLPAREGEAAVQLAGLGRLTGRLVDAGDGEATGPVRFELDDGQGDALRAVAAAHVALDQPLIDELSRAAAQVSAAFESVVDSGELSMEALFDTDYEPISGTDPQQYRTAYTDVLDRILPPIQEPMLEVDDRIAFCAAVDRNGYLPTHNKKYSQPQRPDDPVWNTANSRNRRIFTDRTGQAAGANTQPFLIQSYVRDMGGGSFVLMKDMTVPITVKGKQWGNLRLGYKP